eukprot:5317453-Amphidinium_carterae.1
MDMGNYTHDRETHTLKVWLRCFLGGLRSIPSTSTVCPIKWAPAAAQCRGDGCGPNTISSVAAI